ncbi:putative endopeptidase precursor [Corynebacterium kalinowskii]|uniref:Endopeptidase n=1 Tax=Corynebacterium kalinowskii TaxID=2675216 RepID=A0A6B8VRR1_9CORY|nr:C40 family peptidase [Corynebacterium kalinowskii]QGU01695.1 putative endopeptidase precursor [Corynebacterium kalinowskii]
MALNKAACAAILAAAAVVSVGVVPSAVADPVVTSERVAPETPRDMDSLMKELSESSDKVSAQNEEFKQLQVEIEGKEKDLASVKEQARAAEEAGNAAREQEREAKKVVDKLAASKYRGSVVDPLTTVINANGPQNAIDRSAYMSAYVRKAQEALDTQREKSAEAGRLLDEAARLEAESQFQFNELEAKRTQLEKRDEELKKRIEEIKKSIDSLSPDDRSAWENKNGPVSHDLAGITSTNAEGMKALEAAMTKIGAPYGWGAAGPNQFDCSGLVVWSYAQQGKSLPRTSQAQMAGGMPVSRGDLQPGDVVGFYPGATHVGIYAGDGKIVHASDYGIPLQVVNMDSMPFYGARRY